MGSLTNGVEKGRHIRNDQEEEEPILMDKTQRFCTFPIRYKQLWEMYKKAEASFWTGNIFSFAFFNLLSVYCLCFSMSFVIRLFLLFSLLNFVFFYFIRVALEVGLFLFFFFGLSCAFSTFFVITIR